MTANVFDEDVERSLQAGMNAHLSKPIEPERLYETMARLICRNFFYMASRYPRAGGIYDYTKEVFGYDRAFLVFWFLSLTYIAMFWANATSLPLFARFFIGETFKTGYLFTVFGYEVYLGEALLTICAIAAVTCCACAASG